MMKKALLLSIGVSMAVLSACSKKDNNPLPGQGACLADQITMTQSKIVDHPSSNSILLTFDIKNTSTTNYDIVKGTKIVMVKVIVTTTDNATYESTTQLPLPELSAGATASGPIIAEYGAGKTYKSYKIEKSCKDL